MDGRRARCWILVGCTAVGSLSSGCVHVKPYERGKLAHPTMTREEQGRAAAHVLAVHEGAAGGGALSESGCGCN